MKDLARDIAAIQDVSKLNRIAALIDREMPAIRPALQVYKQTDEEALNEYRAYFDRAALQDPWQYEGNFSRFEHALDELIALLNTGIAKGKAVAKRQMGRIPRVRPPDGKLPRRCSCCWGWIYLDNT